MEHAGLNRIQEALQKRGYISDAGIAMSIFLAMELRKPLLVEGPPGVGKTEIAKVMTQILDTEMIRLQCYEGLDMSHAIYEWNYQLQLLYLKLQEKGDISLEEKENQLFSDKFLIKRPLLQAITREQPPVLLIDEIDRADEAFESYFLELLSDWQITIPETGTIRAIQIPFVVITSNRIRELSEALRRRCLYLWIDYPDFVRELQIVKTKIPTIDSQLAVQITHFMQEVRQLRLEKTPGVAETLDWAAALAALHFDHLDEEIVSATLGIIIKDWQDIRKTQLSLSELLERVGAKTKLEEL